MIIFAAVMECAAMLYNDTSDNSEQRLAAADIRVTAVRLLVLKAVEAIDGVFSLSDVAQALPSVDNSSVFRTLTLFAQKHILHVVDDGSGMQKYCLCRCQSERHQGHIHLTCSKCHKTICLKDVQIPVVPLPEGFVAEESEYVVKGICRDCQSRKS